MREDNLGISSAMAMLIVAIIIVGSVGAYVFLAQDEGGHDGLGVVVTIVPQVEFAERVGGDKVTVTVMVPPGESPHDYEPTVAQLQEVAEAEIYFKVGSGVEFETAHLQDLLDVNSQLIVIDCSKNITLLEAEEHDHDEDEHDHDEEEHDHEGSDPHVWLSPSNAIKMVEELTAGLKEIDPENSDYYQSNADAYIAELTSLHEDIREQLAPYEGESFIVQHPAWGYFAQEYGLEQMAVQSFGNTPTAEELKELIDHAEEHNITAIFVSPQFDTTSAQAIADEVGATTIMVNPLAENYIDNLEDIADKLAEAFGPE